jgi:hypothetical protein
MAAINRLQFFMAQPTGPVSKIIVWLEAVLIKLYMRLSRSNFNSIGEAFPEVIRAIGAALGMVYGALELHPIVSAVAGFP